MKSIISLLLLLMTFNLLKGQSNIRNKSIQVDIGTGNHGTGDIGGYNFSIDFVNQMKSKLSLSFGFASTIHSGQKQLFFQAPTGELIDGSFRYNNSGFQVGSKLGINFIKTTKTELGIKVGGFLRYQSSSVPDDLTTLFPLATGLPFPVYVIANSEPQETLSLGTIGQLFFNQMISKNLFIGLSTGFQIDTNGDAITQLSLSTGIRIK